MLTGVSGLRPISCLGVVQNKRKHPLLVYANHTYERNNGNCQNGTYYYICTQWRSGCGVRLIVYWKKGVFRFTGDHHSESEEKCRFILCMSDYLEYYLNNYDDMTPFLSICRTPHELAPTATSPSRSYASAKW